MWISFCRWVVRLFGGYTSERIDNLESRLADNAEVLMGHQSLLRGHDARLAAFRGEYERAIEGAELALANAARTQRALESQLEAEREKIMVHSVTIDTLVAQHKLVLERVEADTAIECQKKAAVSMANTRE